MTPTSRFLMVYGIAERVRGVGPLSRPWQGRIIAAIRYPLYEVIIYILGKISIATCKLFLPVDYLPLVLKIFAV